MKEKHTEKQGHKGVVKISPTRETQVCCSRFFATTNRWRQSTI